VKRRSWPSRGLALYEALAIARQIVDALEAAHDQGIVHRDLKPANIKVRADGEVKVLDFGLAKFGAGWAGGAGSAEGNVAQGFSPAGMSQSPTIMPPAQTMGGVVLGTAAYMSPEQARGKAVDKRTDIWAFGAVLFEMLTGAPAFGGEAVSDSIANVLGKDPDWNALPASTPASVRRLMTRCLERDPKRRLHDIADARLDLEEAIGQNASEPPRSNLSSPSRMTPAVVGLVAAVALLVGAAGAYFAMRNRPVGDRPTPEVVRFTVGLPAGFTLSPYPPSAVLSPDGRYLAIVARDERGKGAIVFAQRGQTGNVVGLFRVSAFAVGRDPNFSVSPDGQRFLMLRPIATTSAGAEIVITLNWLEELKRLVPITKH
jgi:serine/threonine protein kinase